MINKTKRELEHFKAELEGQTTTVGHTLRFTPPPKEKRKVTDISGDVPVYEKTTPAGKFQGLVPKDTRLCMGSVSWIHGSRKRPPDEQRNMVVELYNGIQLFGKVIDGTFCSYELSTDSFYTTSLKFGDRRGIKYFAYTSPVKLGRKPKPR